MSTDTAEDTSPPEEPAADLLLSAVDLVAGYVPGVNILNGTSLQLHDGELVGVIGPNGAGKSTLIKALFGLIPVRSGQVIYQGQDVTGMKAHALVERGIGYVPQSNNVFPRLTVEENLQMGVYVRPKTFAAADRRGMCAVPSPGRTPGPAGRLAVGRRAPDAVDGPGHHDGPSGPAAGRAVGRPVARAAGRGVHQLPAHQRGRRVHRDGGAERQPLPPDLPPRVCARPGPERLHQLG